MINYNDDGITHINIYSKGKTQLGQWLSNFSYSPFTHPEDGNFNSVEGYWYWLSSKDDKLRELYGFKAKEYGRSIGAPDWVEDDEFKRKIKLAIDAKINSNEQFKNEFRKSTLPFCHYYVYGDKVVEPKSGKWIIEFLENLRRD